MQWLAVALGGALGAMLRYGVMLIPLPAAPWGTLAVNCVGSGLMGALVGVGAFVAPLPEPWRLFLMVGALGALTTFSSFALDAYALLERGQGVMAAAYVLASVLGALICFVAGLQMVRMVYG